MLHRGFTTVRDNGGCDFGLAQAVEEGSLVGPRLHFCGKALSATGPCLYRKTLFLTATTTLAAQQIQKLVHNDCKRHLWVSYDLSVIGILPWFLYCCTFLRIGGHGDFRSAGEVELPSCKCCANPTIGRVCDGEAACRAAARDEIRKGATHLKVHDTPAFATDANETFPCPLIYEWQKFKVSVDVHV